MDDLDDSVSKDVEPNIIESASDLAWVLYIYIEYNDWKIELRLNISVNESYYKTNRMHVSVFQRPIHLDIA